MTEILIDGRIDAWLAAGLIDAATADALRADEAARIAANHAAGTAAPDRPGTLAALFGPSVSIAEVFGYLGGAFILASWLALVGVTAGEVGWPMAFGLLVAAAALTGIGFVARTRSERYRRGAGVAFLAAGGHLGGAVFVAAGELIGRNDPIVGLIAAAAWVAATVTFRRIHPALMTQLGVVVAIISFAGATMSWLEPIIFGQPSNLSGVEPDSILRPVLLAIGWGVTAVVLGIVGLWESRSGLPGAGIRAALTRFAAGMTVIVGTATAVVAYGMLENGEYGRLIPVVVGDAALIVVSVILLERAARRSANAFLYPAALGIIIAATDLNATYLGIESPSLALLVEGAILLGAGVAADRFRRRVARAADTAEATAVEATAADPIA